MTTQEAIAIQKWLHNNHFLFNSTFEKVQASTDMAIRSLEAWETVKKEIKSLSNSFYFSTEFDLSKGLDIALESINKHLQEVEQDG